ncbi:MAG: response regulator [Candidatus Omnitrophota bacterium]|jgi:DNA-binding response OmpR family regulator
MLNLPLKKILIVDDEQDVLVHLSNILKRANFEVITTTQGKEVVSLAQTSSPELILLDFVLTDIDGSQVCRYLKDDQSTKDIPVIMMTGFATESAKEKFRSSKADDCISKPFTAEDLLAKIKEVLRVKDLSLLKKKRVLLVDDDPGFLKMLKLKLEENDYQVVTASTGKAALAEFLREKPGVVLLGITVPELDGLQLLERIKKEDQDLPVFIITAFSHEERFKLARKLNASGFVFKSMDLNKEINQLLAVLP